MLKCIPCSKQLNNGSLHHQDDDDDAVAGTPRTKQAIKALTAQVTIRKIRNWCVFWEILFGTRENVERKNRSSVYANWPFRWNEGMVPVKMTDPEPVFSDSPFIFSGTKQRVMFCSPFSVLLDGTVVVWKILFSWNFTVLGTNQWNKENPDFVFLRVQWNSCVFADQGYGIEGLGSLQKLQALFAVLHWQPSPKLCRLRCQLGVSEFPWLVQADGEIQFDPEAMGEGDGQ